MKIEDIENRLAELEKKLKEYERLMELPATNTRLLTRYVRKKYGVAAALNFHINYIQPIQDYFRVENL